MLLILGRFEARRQLLRRVVAALACATCVILVPLAGAPADGRLRVIDGDTLVLDGERLRLEGIDAPELGQTCLDASGRSWPCGAAAARHLRELAAAGPVSCTGTERDAYGRLLATCRAGERTLNRAMVVDGYAFAFTRYSHSYEADEATARRARAGLWAGTAERPWDYRSRKWAGAQQTAPGDCRIKGNISERGRIYHMPWSSSYARTRIDPARGERWFCSEAEALAAGWRPPS
ncbi:thermonuclease family protein [Polymorphum gilvum]|uniref:Nuclease (SNase-like) protein n=1 Tax=Polymorphum gilvum (strain LMG 25793 / CGMCC 1.9160 / SL003B-26A1) TaxID=991905 RepID=F2IV68_POLGS|nr:thermonuclease family protein [Polymorphum gilvum]ADZ71399.1 Nuclease (SNase-like) protein [Polymorphum gilvum SL003B-26A1]